MGFSSGTGEGNGTPLQYSCLENPMDGGAWWAAVHGVAMSRTWLSDFTFTLHFPALEKEMATHSSVLAWRIPGTGEPGGLPSMGSNGVGHDWSDLAAAATLSDSLLHNKVSWHTNFLLHEVPTFFEESGGCCTVREMVALVEGCSFLPRLSCQEMLWRCLRVYAPLSIKSPH